MSVDPSMKAEAEREAALFQAAAQLTGTERASFLNAACHGNPFLRQRLEALLTAHEQTAGALAESSRDIKRTMKLELTDVPDETIGQKIGRYKILEKVGEGGCGVVYVAEQTEPVRRRVALKVIKLGMDTKAVVARFEAERQALAMMDHPNIAKVLDAGSTETGRPYFIMELVRGIRITEYCDQNNLPTKDRLDLFIQVCHAIQHAHQKGIIHRDIKPSNILVTLHDGVPVPKVIDFGIAKATEGRLTDATVYTQLHQFIGTPAYMSPEQAEMSGLDVDTRSDVYSLGVLLYELLTGKTPFDGQELMSRGIDAMRKTIREKEPSKPSTRLATLQGEDLTTTAKRRSVESSKLAKLLRGDIDWIVMKCLEKDRTRRYETANALAMDIHRHLNTEPVVARPPSKLYEFQKSVRRHKVGFAATAAIILVLAAGVTLTTWQAVRAMQAERTARAETQRAVTAENTAQTEAQRATKAEALASKRLAESELARKDAEAITKFLTGMFDSALPGAEKGGREVKVADVLDRAAAHLEIDLAEQPDQRAKLQETLAHTYRALGLYREAMALREIVLDFRRATSGSEHSNTLEAMNNLAVGYRDVGRRDEAVKLQEEALPLYRKVLGPEHPETLTAMNVLAIAYQSVGRLDDALKLQEEELTIARKVHGPEHSKTLTAMNNLASLCAGAGRLDEALKLQEEALALLQKVSGSKHPLTLTAMNNLAGYYADAGRRDEALKLREEALALDRKVLGPEHPDTLLAMGNLASSYIDAGRRDEALKLQEETLGLSRKVLGPDHPETLRAMGNLTASYDKSDRREEASKLREEVLTLQRKVSGPKHPDTIRAMLNLASSYHNAGRRAEALTLQEEALTLSRKVLGREHPDTIRAMRALASSYNIAGRHEEALNLQEEALTLSRKVLGPDHPDTGATAADLGFAFDQVGAESNGHGQKTVAVWQEALRIDPKNANVQYWLARKLVFMNRLEEAVVILRAASEIYPGGPRGLEMRERLAKALSDLGRKDEAREVQEDMLKRQEEAVKLLAEQPVLNSDETELAMRVATRQAWLGQETNYLATCRRMLQWAEPSQKLRDAERVAKLASLHPTSDLQIASSALKLARRAVNLGQSDTNSLLWYELALGMAEYRNGNYSQADESLRSTTQKGLELTDAYNHYMIPTIGGYYRAMALFQQGTAMEARALFKSTEAFMRPLPNDTNALPDGITHDDLIVWLAWKEAKALLNMSTPSKP